MKQITYHIYGRKAYANPLKFVGEVAVAQETELTQAALQKFGAEGWVELVALPTSDLLTIIPKAGGA